MKLFLQIGLTRFQEDGIGNIFLKYASGLSGDMMGADLSSQSESMIVDMVVRMVGQSQHVFLFVIASDPNLPLGTAHRVFDDLRNSEKVVRVVLCGEHRTAESLLNGHPRFVKENNHEAIRQLIREFGQSGVAVS